MMAKLHALILPLGAAALLVAACSTVTPMPDDGPTPSPDNPPGEQGKNTAPEEPAKPKPYPEEASHFDGHAYHLYTQDGVSADDARAACEKLGAGLLEVNTEDEIEFVRVQYDASLATINKGVWISGKRCEDGKAWCWDSGEAVSLPYTHRYWTRNCQSAPDGEAAPLFLTTDSTLCANPDFRRDGIGGYVCEWSKDGAAK